MTPLEVLEALDADISFADNESMGHFPGIPGNTHIDTENALAGATLARTRLHTAEGTFLVSVWKVEE